jgi:hypothetical protein
MRPFWIFSNLKPHIKYSRIIIMLRKLTPVAIVALLLLGNIATAQVKLQWKSQAGTKARIQTTVESKQTLTIMGIEIPTNSEQFMILNVKSGKTDDGKETAEFAFETLQTVIELQGAEFQFDSGNPDKEVDIPQLEPIAKLMRASIKSRWRAIIGKDGKVEKVTYTKDMRDSVPDALKKELDPNKFKKQQHILWARIPNKPVKKGDTWTRTEKTDFGQGQIFEFERKFKYVGTVDEAGRTLDKIEFKTTKVNFSVAEDSPLQVNKSDLKVSASEGVFLFDRERGYITKTSDKFTIEGSMEFVILGVEQPGKLALTMKSVTTHEIVK